MSRHHANVAGHHLRSAYLAFVHAKATAARAAAGEVRAGHSGYTAPNPRVGHGHVHVREDRLASANTQRAYCVHVMNVDHVDVGDVHHVDVAEAASVPGVEGIKRTHRTPANGSEPESEAHVSAKTKEGHECRRPEWTIVRIN